MRFSVKVATLWATASSVLPSEMVSAFATGPAVSWLMMASSDIPPANV